MKRRVHLLLSALIAGLAFALLAPTSAAVAVSPAQTWDIVNPGVANQLGIEIEEVDCTLVDCDNLAVDCDELLCGDVGLIPDHQINHKYKHLIWGKKKFIINKKLAFKSYKKSFFTHKHYYHAPVKKHYYKHSKWGWGYW